MTDGENDGICRLVDDCPLLEDCRGDREATPSSCPMKGWSFDDVLCESPRCLECDSLNRFEEDIEEEMTNRDRKDLSLYWMEHLNRHLERFGPQKIAGTQSRQY